MRQLLEEYRVGLHYLEDVTALLQRIRGADPTAGLYEAADLQWWWRTPRATDDLPQLFWFDHHGRPEAAVIATDWGDRIALDPIVMPDVPPDWVAHVITRGLAHADESGLEAVGLEVDRDDDVLRGVLIGHGFAAGKDATVETWLAADARPGTSLLHEGYRLCSRVDTMERPHHLTKRNHPDVEARLRQTSLYRPDLDLVVLDSRNSVAAYGLFWYDPETATGLVEPMRTEDDHQRRGLARHILTTGIDLLAGAGAARIKICFEPDNPASRNLYLSAGFEPDRQTVVFSGRTSRGASWADRRAGTFTLPDVIEPVLLDWLLDSDPALRWQVERDLARAPEEVWRATRARVEREGFGARLLALQDPDGQWAAGAFFPRDLDPEGPEAQEGAGQPWTATTWSLNSLREWGLDASVLSGTAELLAANSRWEYEDLPYWGGEVDCCINAYTLANGAWLGADVSGIADWFVEHRLPDGGWNCEWTAGSTRSSFHSTLNSLKGLLWYENLTGATNITREARRGGEEYLLQRGLYRRLSTGEPVGPWTTEFAYPYRWVYSVLSAADYFRAAALVDDRPPDPRMAEAIGQIRAARRPDGTWVQAARHPGRVWFEVDVPVGEPSRWLTFYATRVLEWWDATR